MSITAKGAAAPASSPAIPIEKLDLGPYNIQYLPDGHSMMISSSDGSVSLWDTTTTHSIDVACRIAGRNLTQDEWRDALGARPYRETCSAPERH